MFDPLSKNPTCLFLEIFAIEMQYAYYKNNFTHVSIALINSKTTTEF